MQVSITDAQSQLGDLVRRAEAGEDVVLTQHDVPAVRLVRVVADDDLRERRRKALDEFSGCLKGHPGLEGVTAANIADFLYNERGLPA